jgi:hypothetical protein
LSLFFFEIKMHFGFVLLFIASPILLLAAPGRRKVSFSRHISFLDRPRGGWNPHLEPEVRRVVSDPSLRLLRLPSELVNQQPEEEEDKVVYKPPLEIEITHLMAIGDFERAEIKIIDFMRCPVFAQDPKVGQRLADLAIQHNRTRMLQELLLVGAELREDQRQQWSFKDAIRGQAEYQVGTSVDVALLLQYSPLEILQQTQEVYPHHFGYYDIVRDRLWREAGQKMTPAEKEALIALDTEFFQTFPQDKVQFALKGTYVGPRQRRFVERYVKSGNSMHALMQPLTWPVRMSIIQLLQDESEWLTTGQAMDLGGWIHHHLTPEALAESHGHLVQSAEDNMIQMLVRHGFDVVKIYHTVTQGKHSLAQHYAQTMLHAAGSVMTPEQHEALEKVHLEAQTKSAQHPAVMDDLLHLWGSRPLNDEDDSGELWTPFANVPANDESN